MFVPNIFTALFEAAGYGLRGTTLDALIVQDRRCVAVASCTGDHGTSLLFRFCLQNIVLVCGTVFSQSKDNIAILIYVFLEHADSVLCT